MSQPFGGNGFEGDFTVQIEELVQDKGMSYMEAVLHWCEERNLEPDVGAFHVKKNPVIKSKLELEAESLNFIPKTARLPI